MTVDYKKFYRRCKATYPFVVDHLTPDTALSETDLLPEIFNSFMEITGYTQQDIEENKKESRLLFIAVAVKLSDSLFFSFNDGAPYRLLYSIGRVSGSSRNIISYNLRKVKNYWKVYPDFRNRVDEICNQIKAK